MGGTTGVFHVQVHPHKAKNCFGEIEYNGSFQCNECGMNINPISHPAIYAGLFNHRYPKRNFSDHPNFNYDIYNGGVIELEQLRKESEDAKA